MNQIKLEFLKNRFSIATVASLPNGWIENLLTKNKFFSYIYDVIESTIICEADDIPETLNADTGWSALRVIGPIPFSEVGVLANLLEPFSQNGVSILAVSTFSTDYVFFKTEKFEIVKKALSLKNNIHIID